MQASVQNPAGCGPPARADGRRQRQGARWQPPAHTQAARRIPAPPQGFFGDLFEFEKWAPKSSQAWRLGNSPADLRRLRGEESEDEITEGDVEVLNARLAEARQQGGAAAVGAAAAAAAQEARAAEEEEDAFDSSNDQPSFLRSTDEEVAAALADRIQEVASSKPGPASSADGGGDGGVEGEALTGPLLRELIFAKWGKTYDVAFARRDLPLGKKLVVLNVMWHHLEQRSFPMSEAEYDEKLDMVALYISSWGQAERVASFLRQPARPRKGMPSKPIVGTAVSIQLDLEDAVIEEFFSQGGA